jgi:hypothetical protein
MEAKKTARGRKPIKDKKKTIRIYVRESEIKEMGGEKKLIQKLYGFIEREINHFKI